MPAWFDLSAVVTETPHSRRATAALAGAATDGGALSWLHDWSLGRTVRDWLLPEEIAPR